LPFLVSKRASTVTTFLTVYQSLSPILLSHYASDTFNLLSTFLWYQMLVAVSNTSSQRPLIPSLASFLLSLINYCDAAINVSINWFTCTAFPSGFLVLCAIQSCPFQLSTCHLYLFIIFVVIELTLLDSSSTLFIAPTTTRQGSFHLCSQLEVPLVSRNEDRSLLPSLVLIQGSARD
jgi:hypothetical protein